MARTSDEYMDSIFRGGAQNKRRKNTACGKKPPTFMMMMMRACRYISTHACTMAPRDRMGGQWDSPVCEGEREKSACSVREMRFFTMSVCVCVCVCACKCVRVSARGE